MRWHEINFDGLVGPTHNYAGLSFGNVASTQHQGAPSNPKQAALQGLAKMHWLMERGFLQAVLPPQARPSLPVLHRLGFRGTPAEILVATWQQAPQLFSMCCSASAMWVANAATIIPSCDNLEGQCVIIPANLISNVHRNIEVPATRELLAFVFADLERFRIEQPLPEVAAFADEGAANHMRIALPDQQALHIFVYGKSIAGGPEPQQFPARQTREACMSLARLGGVQQERSLLVQQNPRAIDAGVFHNDVIAVAHDGLLLCHEHAFLQQSQVLADIRRISGNRVTIVEVKEADVPLPTAIRTYLFNSQILGEPGQRRLLLPIECERDEQVKHYVETHLRDALQLAEIAYLDLQQSMRNGGGPACLRLRVTLNDKEINALQGRLLLNRERYQQLVDFVEKRYPESLTLEQLTDWKVAEDMIQIVHDLHELLGLPFYLSNTLE